MRLWRPNPVKSALALLVRRDPSITNTPSSGKATARAFGHYDWTAELGRVCVPALILQGLDDALTRPGGSVILSRGIPRSRLVMVPGAGHNLPVEMPTLFIAAVLAFLAGVDL